MENENPVMQEPTTEEQTKYTKEELVANAKKVFDVKPEVVKGALYGNEGSSFTKDEIKELIEKFMNRRVN
jgi:hypothetical protein